MDVLADVLDVTQLANSILGQAELRAPWAIAIDPTTEATVHVVQLGSCWFSSHGEPPVMLSEGDVVLLPRGGRHVLSDKPSHKGQPLATVLSEMLRRRETNPDPGAAAVTHVLCAKYRFGLPEVHPLITRLPPVIHLRSREAAASGRLQMLIHLLKAECEAGGDGSEVVVPRLVDSLMVFLLRSWIESGAPATANWFAALRDPGISRALGQIHRQPDRGWTVTALADAAGQTRATFARRFSTLVGETPIAYLTRWRICLAARQLRERRLSIEQTAFAAGYDSAAAFSRAFKRHYGIAPSEFRAVARAA